MFGAKGRGIIALLCRSADAMLETWEAASFEGDGVTRTPEDSLPAETV